MDIEFDDYHYVITFKKGSSDKVIKAMFNKKLENFENRDCTTILKYHLSDALGIEYYSFLHLVENTELQFENAIKQIIKAFLREDLRIPIDLPSDYYLLKSIFRGGWYKWSL